MTEKQAVEKGYRNTGIYGRYKDIIKERKKVEFSDLGYRAVMVIKPDSKYSRGPIGEGYSVYAEQRYFDDRRYEMFIELKSQIIERKERARQEYDDKMKEIEADALKYDVELNRLLAKKEA